MSINSNSGTEISLEQAKKLTACYREKFANEIKGSFVGKDKLDLILKQPGCIGIRVYNGYDIEEGRLAPVFVGVDQNGRDITDGVIIDKTMPCPNYCDGTSPLIGR